MIKLDCWLPEKEMFGRFSLDTIAAEGDRLTAVVSNEVFQFTIVFPRGVGAHRVTQGDGARLADLRAEFEVYMRGNTFFKLTGTPYLDQFGGAVDVHYLIDAPNCTVDILSSVQPEVLLAPSPVRNIQ